MARRNKLISHPGTGQSIRFIQTREDTGGGLLEMESCFAPHSIEPIAHYHPVQEELFTVLEGELSVRIDGTIHRFAAGERLKIAPGTVHSMWNEGSVPTRVNWKVTPALQTEYLLETAMGLAMEVRRRRAVAGVPSSTVTLLLAQKSQNSRQDMPPLLQMVLLMRRYQREFRIARPAFPIQKILFTLLSPIARMAGYREEYPEYWD